MKDSYIIGIGNVPGENCIPFKDLSKRFGTSTRKLNSIKRRYGNSCVYRFTKQKGLEESACEALEKATKNAGISLNEIDGLFYTPTTSGRYYVPDFGKIVSSKLGLSDVLLVPSGTGCTGGLSALFNAYNALVKDSCQQKISNYVILVGEANELHTSENPEMAFLFSDNASSVVVSNNPIKNGYLINSVNGTTTKGDPFSMTLHNPSLNEKDIKNGFRMQGDGVFSFAMDQALPRFASLVNLEKISDAKYFIPSQTIIALLKQMIIQENLDKNRVYTDGMIEKGNTNGGGIFDGLEDAIKKGYIGNQDDVLMSVFGVNLQVYSTHLLPYGNVNSIIGANKKQTKREGLESRVDISFRDKVEKVIGGFCLRRGIKV
jgi:3-oxoacyl-[acyl-carrier-protein] synthase III